MDQVVPIVKYLCRDGSVVECVDEVNSSEIKGKVIGDHLDRGVVMNGEFVPGEVLKVEDGDERFVPGQWADGHFTVGQVVEVGGVKRFCPGQVSYHFN